MSKSLLLTRPNHDHLTMYLYFWSEKIIEVAKSKSYNILDFRERKANKKDFTSYIRKNKPNLIVINGHGNEHTVTGYDNEPLINYGENSNLLENTISYIRSCSVGAALAADCIMNKAIAIIAYKRKFTLPTSASNTTNPLGDPLASLFLNPSNLVPISLLKGNTVIEAHNKSRMEMYKNFNFMLSTKASPAQRDAAIYMWSNLKGQVVMGDENASL